MKGRAVRSVGVFHIGVLAALSSIVLVGISVSRAYHFAMNGNQISAVRVADSALNEKASTPYTSIDWQAPREGVESSSSVNDPDGISNIEDNVSRALLGSYATLSDTGFYTPQDGEKIANDIASSLRANVSYKTFVASDLSVDNDTSYDRMLKYRGDLRIALEPLLGNPGYELSLFANYVESHDPSYLDKLKKAAENYEAALENAAKLSVPKDAVTPHTAVLNALSKFGTIVRRLSEHADDAFASAALLQTYNASESNLLTSFNSLAMYYRTKQQ